jgi:hypothetical protein
MAYRIINNLRHYLQNRTPDFAHTSATDMKDSLQRATATEALRPAALHGKTGS